jgi:hypothetical protein
MAQPLHFLPSELNSYRFCILDAPCAGKVPGSLRSVLAFLGCWKNNPVAVAM